jgi:L-ascorbate metabolism protein UlaG (beta-lactamase superfamily)
VRRLVSFAASVFFVTDCAQMNPYYDATKAHHRPDGFRNVGPNARLPHPAAEFFRWQRERLALNVPGPTLDLAPVPPRRDLLHASGNHFAATWIGHATVLVRVGAAHVITDPHFSDRASPVQWAGPRRWQPPGVPLSDLPRIDVVLISHNHYDHLDADSVKRLNEQPGGPPLFVVPLGLERWLESQGVTHSKALDWWDQTEHRGVTVALTPVQHWSRRTLADTNTTLWGGFIVEGESHGRRRRVFFPGDTGYYAQHFLDIGARFGPIDLALLPIGAYEPRWFMRSQHINPAEAVQVHRDIRAVRSLGIHWGTFQLTDEPIDQAVHDLAAARSQAGLRDDEFFVVRHGQTIEMD